MKEFLRRTFYFVTEKLASRKMERTELLPAFQLHRTLPKNFDPVHTSYFERELKKTFGPVTQVVVQTPLLVVEEGIVLKRGHMVSESLMNDSIRNWFGPSFLLNAYKKSKLLPFARYLYVYNHFGAGYGHWLADVLPRLFMLKEHAKEYILVLPEHYSSFHLETLKPFGIGREQVQFLERGASYRLPQVTLVSHVGTSCNTKDEVLQELRAFYLNYYVGSQWPVPSKKLYISRSRMKNRRVMNEMEVEELLIQQGFQILYPEESNFEEQVKLFAECKVLVGLTGSGLTNMLFMQKGSAVVEFKMEEDFKNLHYFSMSSAMQLDYYYLLCKTKGEDRFTADFKVDLESLEAVLEEIIKK